jgi:hypothetical protein
MADEQRHTVTIVPLSHLSKRVYRDSDKRYWGDKRHCPVCGREASYSLHADGMPALPLECQIHPELNPMGWTLEELIEQYDALARWRTAERRRAPEAY